MYNLNEQIEENIKELQYVLMQMESFDKKAPKGSLRISKSKGGNERYYHRIKDQKTGTITQRYISKRQEMPLIRQLAQKTYQDSLKPILEKEIVVLEKLKRAYDSQEKERSFEKLSEERKKLVTPYYESSEEKYRKWKEDSYPAYHGYQEYLRFETDRGELVRSKSELIIANILYQFRDQLHYRYEAALELKKCQFTIHPDFTIMSRRTAKIVYWEHAGGLGQGDYADDFARKMNAYIREGIMPGKDLIVTYETKEVPLDVSVVRRILKTYI